MKLIPLVFAVAAFASAPSLAQQLDDTGNLLSPSMGTTVVGGAINGVGCGSGTTTSHFLAGNGQSGNMFDIAVHGADMTIECLDIHVSSVAGTLHDVEIFAVPGTCVGKDTGDLCAHGWVKIGTGSATSAGSGFPTSVNLTPVGAPYVFSANSTYGIYVTLIGSTAIRYTNGGPTTYAGTHCDLTTRFGKSAYTPPCTLGSTFTPREFNGTLYTELAGPLPPSLSASGSCPGSMTLSVANCTPSSNVAVLYGVAGAFTKPTNPCAGLVLGISSPSLGAMLGTDAGGAASMTFNAPAAACGKTVQAVDVASCVATNTVVL
jgi:hypothetical protein